MLRVALVGAAGSALALGLITGTAATAAEDESDARLQPKLDEVAAQTEAQIAAEEEEFYRLADEQGIESESVSAAGRQKVVKVSPTLDIPNRKMGVAQTVTMRFPIPVARKPLVEKNIVVTGDVKTKKGRQSVKLPDGRWGWLDDQTAVYRTRNFWPGKTNVRFRLKLKDVTLRDDPDTRYVGGSNAERVETLKTARSFVMIIKNSTHHMYVYQNGNLRKKFGVSLGRGGDYATRSGIKVLTGVKYQSLRMRGTDRATGETWDVNSPYSQPITTNGEFIHAAPWARYRIGYANGSHGCTNMNIEDARWLFYRTREGDPLVTKGTGRSMYSGLALGQGKYWTYSYTAWKKMSSLPMKLDKGKSDSKKSSGKKNK
ncbi:MAG: L,D-transpeptidase [Actinobacteria bacterium]|nr:L,D-transpeptidase [Actinomycetota bacterium]